MDLTGEQCGLLFDYSFRCSEQLQRDRVAALITSNPQAARLHACIQQALARLEHIKDEACPDELADLTIARLKLYRASSARPHKNRSHGAAGPEA